MTSRAARAPIMQLFERLTLVLIAIESCFRAGAIFKYELAAGRMDQHIITVGHLGTVISARSRVI